MLRHDLLMVAYCLYCISLKLYKYFTNLIALVEIYSPRLNEHMSDLMAKIECRMSLHYSTNIYTSSG